MLRIKKLNLDRLHQTLELKRSSKISLYNTLQGIGKTMLLLENLTQLKGEDSDKSTIYPIFCKTLIKIEIRNILYKLQFICNSKELKFNIPSIKIEGINLFVIKDKEINITLMFISKLTKENSKSISLLLSSEFCNKSYILAECESKDLSQDLKKIISKYNLQEIQFI